jgi:hypothetical protein
MYLQRILWRADQLRKFDPKRFAVPNDDRVISLLRSITETTRRIASLHTNPFTRK